MSRFALILSLFVVPAAADGPVGKVLELMDDLAAKIKSDGAAADKAYKNYFEWCDDTTKKQQFEIRTYSAKKEKLEAKIVKLGDEIEVAGPKVEELAAAIASAESEMAKANEVRDKEAAEFAASEAEMTQGIEVLGRAITIISREMQKNPASFAQTAHSRDLPAVFVALGTVFEAASFSTNDQQKLTALIQSQQGDEDEDGEPGAPAAAAYKSKSGDIVDVLEKMQDKAEGELSELRKAEVASKQNHDMLVSSFKDEIAVNNKNLADQKAGKAGAEEERAAATKDLEVAVESLRSNTEALRVTQSDCIKVAAGHEKSISSRAEELKVIAEAKKILQETTGGASLFQVSASTSMRGIRDVSAVVKRLARQQRSSALAQLASRIAAVVKYDTKDPFAKVRGMIKSMIAKLEAEAKDAATEKAFCDEELAKTSAKRSDLSDDQEKLTGRLDQATAGAADAQQAIQELEAELANLAKEQNELDRIRAEENADYQNSKADLEQGLSGVGKALRVLRNYYGQASLLQADAAQPSPPAGHSSSGGGAKGIIGILEVAESDMAVSLANLEAEESQEQSDYEKITQENKVVKAEKDQAIKYKTQEHKTLQLTISELSGDLSSVEDELASVNDYLGKVKARCVAKPTGFEERQKRRAAEIEGLKNALSILESQAALVETGRRSWKLRGARGSLSQ